MGTYTDFTGAIRITPCLKEPLAGRFRQFLGIRHMKRDVKILEALFPTLEERKAVTLFGDGDLERMVHSSCPSIRGISRAASVCTNAMRKGSQMSVT